MKNDERLELLKYLIKTALKNGSETISIGDLEYVFPDLFEEIEEEIQC